MNLASTFSYFDSFKDDNLCFIYLGNFTDDITARAINLSERNIDNVEELSKMRNRVSFLMAECFQNIVRHGENPGVVTHTTDKKGIFITRNIGGIYYITSGNLIETENVEDLRKKLQGINELEKDELKQLYKEVLTNEGLSEKGGAGLGIIEMARKSGQKLGFDFKQVNDQLSMFYLQIQLKSKKAEEEDTDYNVSVQSAIDLHDRMSDEAMVMVHKGDFAQDTIMPVLRMIESNIQNQLERFSVKKIVYHILVEVLQNISIHAEAKGDMKEGIFLMGKNDNKYVINAGNYIENSKIADFKRQLETVNELDKQELRELYKDTLRKGETSAEGGAGLGLIDIARESSARIEFEFTPINDELSFFSLCTKV